MDAGAHDAVERLERPGQLAGERVQVPGVLLERGGDEAGAPEELGEARGSRRAAGPGPRGRCGAAAASDGRTATVKVPSSAAVPLLPRREPGLAEGDEDLVGLGLVEPVEEHLVPAGGEDGEERERQEAGRGTVTPAR